MSTVKFRKVSELFPNRKVRTVRTEQLWLAGYIPRWYTRPKTVTNPSTKQAQRRLRVTDQSMQWVLYQRNASSGRRSGYFKNNDPCWTAYTYADNYQLIDAFADGATPCKRSMRAVQSLIARPFSAFLCIDLIIPPFCVPLPFLFLSRSAVSNRDSH